MQRLLHLWIMIKDVESIASLCSQQLANMPSIRHLSFTDAKNISTLGQIAPGVDIYTIAFAQWTGEITETHASGKTGDYYNKSIEIFVPRRRAVCERIIQELKDRKIVVFAIDYNGDNYRLDFARFASRYTSGKKPGDSHGYTWTFTGVDRKVRFYADATLRELTGEDYVPPAGEETEMAPAPDTTIPIADSCCVTILATPIPEPPLEDGNILNLNKFVTVDGTGEKYFIDKTGRSILLSGGGIVRERIEGTGAATYTLSKNFNPEKVIINRTQNFLIRDLDPPPTEIHTFNIVDDELILPDDWPLEIGEYIEIYEIAA